MSVSSSELEGFDLQTLWALDAAPLAAGHTRALLCTVGDATLAVPIASLRGVEPFAAVSRLPHLPPWVVGVTNVRGTVVGVVDLARFLGLGETPRNQGRLLICAAESRAPLPAPLLVALAVHDAHEVMDYPPTAVVDAAAGAGRAGRYLAGLIQTEGLAVPLLDVGRLLTEDELIKG